MLKRKSFAALILTLPQDLKRDFGIIPNMWQNIARRVARTIKF